MALSSAKFKSAAKCSQPLRSVHRMRLQLKRAVHTILWPLTLCFYHFITICMDRLKDTITGFQEELEVDFFSQLY